jgi:AcrR family transcriptional regulator
VAGGLRERKKAKTRAAIRREAMRLFREQGYEETTVEQIAEAAEVSPSTFFRYFPTKEDVVLRDDYDDLLVEAFRAQPRELSPIQAMRRALRETLGNLTPEEREEEDERLRLSREVPQLRAAMMDELVHAIQLSAAIVGERTGRPADDPAALAFAGAVIGVAISVMLSAGSSSAAKAYKQIDEALAFLEAGLPL